MATEELEETDQTHHLTIAVEGKVQVVTERDDWSGDWITRIVGGRLDGEHFTAQTPLGSMLHHRHALALARQAEEN